MKEYKIGRYPEADIILTLAYGSRDHAKLTVTDTSKILLEDTSSNGTTINGKKIINQTVEIKYGDEILFAGVEKLDWSKIEKPEKRIETPYKPSPIFQLIKKHAAKTIAAFVVIGSILFAFNFLSNFNKVKPEIPLSPNEIYNRYKNAVAMVEVKYYIHIHTKANDLYFGLNASDSIGFDKNKAALKPLTSEGSSFFIDSSGILITNHHVVEPWGHELAPNGYFNTKIKPAIKRALREKGWGDDDPKFNGELEAIYIYPTGKTFSPENRVECSVHRIASEAEIDLASLQINSHQLPPNTSIISIDAIEPDQTKIQVGTSAYVIGFPLGDALAVNEDNVLNCSSTQGSFTQNPATYYVQFSAPVASGASGSPVFNQYGKLVAVTYLGSKEQSFNRGILAKHIQQVR